MIAGIITVIGSLLTITIMVWRYVKRLNSEKRRLADEAKSKLDEAHKTGDKSDLLDSWDRINRV